jgi:hypothetical protein
MTATALRYRTFDAAPGPPPSLRLQYLAHRLHALGERPLHEFLIEIQNGAELLPTLEAYSRLDGNFIKQLGGDKLGDRFALIDGGRK